MNVIPQKIYRLVENRLRQRWELAARARAKLYDAQQAAMAVSSPATDQENHSSGPGDRTQALALRILEAEEQLERAEKWEDAFQMADAAFPFETTKEGVIAGYLYGNGMTIQEACAATGRKRTTVIHLRDNYVAHAALFAAALGLIDINAEREKEHGKTEELADS